MANNFFLVKSLQIKVLAKIHKIFASFYKNVLVLKMMQ